MTSLHTEICDILGIRHPILQGGMGPYKTEDLAIAVTNAGALGVISCIGMAATLLPEAAPVDAVRLFGTDPPPVILQKSIEAVTKGTKKSGGIFGVNIPVAAEFLLASEMFARGVVEAREGDSDIERSLRVIVTSAGNPTPWAQLKEQGLIWAHVVPSVYHAKKAEKAGADWVGSQDFVDKIEKGWLECDAIVAVPEMMPKIGKLGKVLGPRGLMPTPKNGTVTKDIGQAVKEIKQGKVNFKVDQGGNVQVPIGKASFEENALYENFVDLIRKIWNLKPSSASGQYLKGITLSSTMGPGLKIDINHVKKDIILGS